MFGYCLKLRKLRDWCGFPILHWLFSVCLRWFFSFYHGKSPLNHHLGNMYEIFVSKHLKQIKVPKRCFKQKHQLRGCIRRHGMESLSYGNSYAAIRHWSPMRISRRCPVGFLARRPGPVVGSSRWSQGVIQRCLTGKKTTETTVLTYKIPWLAKT